STPQNRDDSALHALRRLPTIASALGHQKERFPDDVSTRGDVDACSRASRVSLAAIPINKLKLYIRYITAF
ncbi:uncharacterized protein K441DRAFT_662170, partial [Cenococcum geophilum 1.58]|uniref:uncharacterized protein n=1 Tax=Cenococcum geophilum 1.58 TaxID=794803 RepID=UPI00358EEC08